MIRQTRRQRLIDILKNEHHTAQSLAKALRTSIHVVLDDLEHVQRSVKRNLILFEAECETCHYTFRNRTKLTKPSRCPKCKKQWISGPILHMEKE